MCKEIPDFEKLNAQYKDQKVKVLLVSLDFSTQVESRVIPFMERMNMKSEVILLNEPNPNRWIPIVSEKWSGAIPATLIYSKNFREFYEREFNFEEFEEIVKPLIYQITYSFNQNPLIMKKVVLLFSILFITMTSFAQGYQVGDKAADFKLRNVDGKYYSMADFPDAKGFVVIFSCNHCPYVVAYEDRMIELHKEFAPKGFPVIAINPNDSVATPGFICKYAEKGPEKKFPFLYLHDAEQKVFPKYGATRTPHVFLLKERWQMI
jgi:peroxiredoxin